MCTVTFVNLNDKIIITSNRDEKVNRQKAINPKTYCHNGKKLFYPKDPKAGGTWYAVDEIGNVIVLLNGSNIKHNVKEKYRQSRGLVVLHLLESKNVIECWNTYNLIDIEPFTLIVYFNNQLYKLQWDSINKHKFELDSTNYYIWSSSTLYTSEVIKSREDWFNEFICNTTDLNEETILNFHNFTKSDDLENGLIINRNENMQTLSISQVIKNINKVTFKYLDLLENESIDNTFLTI